MDAIMEIQIRILAQEAQKQLQLVTSALGSAGAAAGGYGEAAQVAGKSTEAFKDQLVFMGRTVESVSAAKAEYVQHATLMAAVNKEVSAATKEAVASLDAYKALTVETTVSSERLRTVLATEGATWTEKVAAVNAAAEATARQAVIDEQYAIISGKKKEIIVEQVKQLTSYDELMKRHSETQLAYNVALTDSTVSATELESIHRELIQTTASVMEVQKANAAVTKEAALAFDDVTVSIGKAGPMLRDYAQLSERVAQAQTYLRDLLTSEVATWTETVRAIEAAAEATAKKSMVDQQYDEIANGTIGTIAAQTAAIEAATVAMDAYTKLTQENSAAQLALKSALADESSSWSQVVAAIEAATEAQSRLNAVDEQYAEIAGTKIAAIEKETAALTAVGAASGAAAAQTAKGMFGLEGSLNSMGKKLQWTGRQIEYTLGVPLIIVGGIATKFAIDIERSANTFERSYNTMDKSAAGSRAETQKVEQAFELLSNKFGIHQKEIYGVAESWARLGAQGGGLVDIVQQTMTVMALTGMTAEDATKGLEALRQQYHLSAGGIRDASATINSAAQLSGIALKDMYAAVTNGGAAAVAVGVDVKHFAALVSSVAPAAGSASLAATGLRSIFARLIVPSKAVSDVINKIGIDTQGMAWKTSDGAGKLQLLAQAIAKLPPAQRAAAASLIGTRFQFARFDELVKAMVDPMSQYNRVLNGTADANKNLKQQNQQLTDYLKSNPQAFKEAMTTIQNSLARAIAPMLPTISRFIDKIAQVVKWFSNLSPKTRELVVTLLALGVGFGIALRVIGAFSQLFGIIGTPLKALIGAFATTAATSTVTATVVAADGATMEATFTAVAATSTVMSTITMLSWLFIIALIGLAIFAFRDQIGQVFSWLGNFFTQTIPQWWGDLTGGLWSALSSIPDMFVAVFTTVVDIVEKAAKSVYDAFSYMNPFAHHSPSLVENVTHGAAVIAGHYEAMGDSSGYLQNAHGDVQALGSAMRGLPTNISTAFSIPNLKGLASGGTTTSAGSVLIGENGPEILSLPKAATVKPLTRSPWDAINAVSTAALSPPGSSPSGAFDLPPPKAASSGGASSGGASSADTTKAAAITAVNAELKKQEAILKDLETVQKRYNDLLTTAKERLQDYVNTPITGMKAMEDQIFANTQAQNELNLKIMQMEDMAGGSIDEIRSRMAKLNGEMQLLSGQKLNLHNAGAGSDVMTALSQQMGKVAAEQTKLAGSGVEIDKLRLKLSALARVGQELNLEKSIKFDPLTKQIKDLANAQKEMPFEWIKSHVVAEVHEVNKLQKEYDAATAAMKRQKEIVAALNAMKTAAGPAPKSNAFDRTGGKSFTPPPMGDLKFDTSKLDDILNKLKDKMGKFDPFGDLGKKMDKWLGDMPTRILEFGGAIAAALLAIFLLPAELPVVLLAALAAALGFVIGRLIGLTPWSKLWHGLVLAVEWVKDWLLGAFRLVWSKIKEIWGSFTKFFSDLWGNITKGVKEAWDKVKGWFEQSWRGVKKIWGGFTKFFSDLWGDITKGVKEAWDKVKGWFSDAWDNIKKVWNGVKGFFSDIWNGLGNGVKAGWDKVKGWFSDAWDNIKKIWKGVKGFFSDIWNGLGDGLVGIINGVIGGFEWMLNKIVDLVNVAIRAYNHIPFVDDISEIQHVHLSRISGLADGGTLTSAGSVWVGERGPELLNLPTGASVIPLGKIPSGSGSNTYHFHGNMEFPNVKDGHDAESFLRNLESLADE